MYLDNAATTWPKPPEVIEAFSRFVRENGASPGRGGYRRAREAEADVYAVREKIACLINAKYPTQVAFASNATEALNTAIYGVLRSGDHVVSSRAEHNSITRPLFHLCETMDVEVTWLESDDEGRLDPADVHRALRPQTRLVALTHASNVTGAVQPIAEIGEITRTAGVSLLVDAAQSIGHLHIDVERMGIDLLAFPGHKALFGVQGTGGLYVSPDCEVVPLKRGGTGGVSESPRQPRVMPMSLESGTINVGGIVALGAGIDFVTNMGVANVFEHERSLLERLRGRLEALDHLTLYGGGSATVGVLSFNVGTLTASQTSVMLDDVFGIQTRGGLHCAPGMHTFLGTAKQGAVRVSTSAYSTVAEIDATVAAVDEICQSYTRSAHAEVG